MKIISKKPLKLPQNIQLGAVLKYIALFEIYLYEKRQLLRANYGFDSRREYQKNDLHFGGRFYLPRINVSNITVRCNVA